MVFFHKTWSDLSWIYRYAAMRPCLKWRPLTDTTFQRLLTESNTASLNKLLAMGMEDVLSWSKVSSLIFPSFIALILFFWAFSRQCGSSASVGLPYLRLISSPSVTYPDWQLALSTLAHQDSFSKRARLNTTNSWRMPQTLHKYATNTS